MPGLEKLRIAMLVSGGGTTMREIIRATKGDGILKRVQPALVISSRPDAGAIKKALDEGVRSEDVIYIPPTKVSDLSSDLDKAERDAIITARRLAFGERILAECRRRAVDFIGQYGWLPITPANVTAEYLDMMTNQHPAPLRPGQPDFGGERMYGRRCHFARICYLRATMQPEENDPDVYAKRFFSEATCQRVAAKLDKGAVLGRRRVPIEPSDSVEDLAGRMLPIEHALQIETLKAFAEGTVHKIEDDDEPPLVAPGSAGVLQLAKKLAIMMYPKG